MTERYLGKIEICTFSKTMDGFQACNGQLLDISQFSLLFSLMGTAYGGNGRATFGIPDLRGRVPIGLGALTAGQPPSYPPAGNGPRTIPTPSGQTHFYRGQTGGEQGVALELRSLAGHSHGLVGASNAANRLRPDEGRVLATPKTKLYGPGVDLTPLSKLSVGKTGVLSEGTAESHSNIQPSLAVNFVIAVVGAYPTQS